MQAVSNNRGGQHYARQMTFKLKIFFSLTFLLGLNTTFGQTKEKDTTFFTHLTYNDQDKLPVGPNNHLFFWYTKKYIPNTYFIVEHFCWGRWVNRRKVTETSVGKREYFGKTGSKCEYRFKIQPHSGENKLRVLLMNDSNVCLAISKEFKWVSPLTPKVTFTDKKKTKEIQFSTETDYEILDSKGNLVKDDRGTTIFYADLDDGTYTLNYDNSTTTFTKKN